MQRHTVYVRPVYYLFTRIQINVLKMPCGAAPVCRGHEQERARYLEVDPVNSVTDVLEHALIGHEEVAVLEASFTAGGEEQRDTQPSERPHFYGRFLNCFCSFLSLFFLFAFLL